MTTHIAQHMHTANDRNGNPRRGFLVTSVNGTIEAFVIEGYEGPAALAEWVEHRLPIVVASSFVSIEITPAQYNAFVKNYGV
jgi:hypothetical protein